MKKLSRAEMKEVTGGFDPNAGCGVQNSPCSAAPNPPAYAKCCSGYDCLEGRCILMVP